MSVEKIVVVGAGHAAGAFAEALRKKDSACLIMLVGEEAHAPYQRPPLSKAYLAGEMDVQRLSLRPDSFYEKKDISLKLSTHVASIDTAEHVIATAEGEVIPYNKLVMATGTRVRKLPVKGAELKNVHYIRTIDDVKQLHSQWQSAENIVIIGGGFIGLEVAAVAAKGGKKVTVLEGQDRVMPRVVAPVISRYFTEYHRKQGVNIITDANVVEIAGGETGAEAVLCADGSRHNADIVIVGIGVMANVELAEAAGLKLDNGIVVDEYCRSSDPDIFAIGECSNHEDKRYGRLRLESVQNAQDQAKAAAAAISGEAVSYDVVPWFWSEQYDLRLQMAGISTGYDDVVLRGGMGENKFSLLYYRQGSLIAIDSINSAADHMAGRRLLAEGLSPDKIAVQDATVKLKEFLAL